MAIDADGSAPLRAAVIGLGLMGRHHVRVYGEMSQVELVGVADVREAALAPVVHGRLLEGFTDIDEMLDRTRPEIISVAVPTSLHREVVLKAVERGIHVLVEKPIAGTPEDAWQMIRAAEGAAVRLMVGHVERFNPAIVELKRRLAQVGTVYQVAARRVGPFPERIRDVGVVVDLASHDIDVMRFLLGLPVERLYAEAVQHIHTSHEDMLLGTIRFGGGIVGSLDVNWLTPTKVRELSVVGSRGTFVANYLTQDLAFYENSATAIDWDDLSALRAMSEGNAIRYAFRRQEPLRAELEAFVAYVRRGDECPSSPEDAAETLAIALGLIASARTGSPIPGGRLAVVAP